MKERIQDLIIFINQIWDTKSLYKLMLKNVTYYRSDFLKLHLI